LHGASRARAAASICSPCSPVVGIGCRLFQPVYAFTGQVEFNCFPRSPVGGNVVLRSAAFARSPRSGVDPHRGGGPPPAPCHTTVRTGPYTAVRVGYASTHRLMSEVQAI